MLSLNFKGCVSDLRASLAGSLLLGHLQLQASLLLGRLQLQASLLLCFLRPRLQAQAFICFLLHTPSLPLVQGSKLSSAFFSTRHLHLQSRPPSFLLHSASLPFCRCPLSALRPQSLKAKRNQPSLACSISAAPTAVLSPAAPTDEIIPVCISAGLPFCCTSLSLIHSNNFACLLLS